MNGGESNFSDRVAERSDGIPRGLCPEVVYLYASIQLLSKKADLRTSLCILRGWFLNPRLTSIGIDITGKN
jgi:hypothetical protein